MKIKFYNNKMNILINSNLACLDLFVPISSYCNIPYNFCEITNIFYFYFDFYFSSFSLTNFNLQDLVNFSIYFSSSIFLTLGLIFFSGRVGKILDTAAKLVVIAAGSSNLYKNHVGGSDPKDEKESDKDKDKDKEKESDKDKDKEKESDKDKKESDKDKNEQKTTDSNTDSNTAAK